MEFHIWFDESKFPDPADYESSFRYGEKVSSSILKQVRNKRGALPSERFKNMAEAYGDLYGYVTFNDTLVLTPEDLEMHGATPFEDPSNTVIENQAGQLADSLSQKGWIQVETDYCPDDSSLSEFDYFHVYQNLDGDYRPSALPEFADVRDALGQQFVVSTTGLSEYVEARLSHRLDESPTEEQTLAYTASLETLADDLGWVKLSAMEGNERLWVAPDRSYEELLSRFEGQTEITDEEVEDELYTFLQEENPQTEAELQFDVGPFIENVRKKLNTDEWHELRAKDERRWYSTRNAHQAALEEYVEKHRDTFENPKKVGNHTVEARKSAYQFFKQNSLQLSRYGIYDRDTLNEQTRRMKFYIDSGETWAKLDGSETKGGTWTIKYGSDNERE